MAANMAPVRCSAFGVLRYGKLLVWIPLFPDITGMETFDQARLTAALAGA